MPIKIPDDLPAAEILMNENIFVMFNQRAYRQDIRPLQIVILNLMPVKTITEPQILRLLGNSPLQVDIFLVQSQQHECRHTSREHLRKFYRTFDDIKGQKFDGMIITGAPIEHLSFKEVDYWEELQEIMEWAKRNVFSTMFLCWAAQAGLYHYCGIPKYPLDSKMFGVFEHKVNNKISPLMRGFDDRFFVPHSRHSEVRRDDIKKVKELEILAESEEAGVYVVARKDGRQIFVTGHAEYDAMTLKEEYKRDLERGLDIDSPRNYFPNDDPTQEPMVSWRGHAHLLFMNWLNYYVYQETPFDLTEIG